MYQELYTRTLIILDHISTLDNSIIKKKTTKKATITDQLPSVKDCRLAPASPALVELCMHARLYKHRCI